MNCRIYDFDYLYFITCGVVLLIFLITNEERAHDIQIYKFVTLAN